MRLKQTFYEQGDKSGKILAWQIKKLETERAINSIQTPNDGIAVDPLLINDTFAAYYQTLYDTESSGSEQDQSLFLNQIPCYVQ